jgi:hypothetical protein
VAAVRDAFLPEVWTAVPTSKVKEVAAIHRLRHAYRI